MTTKFSKVLWGDGLEVTDPVLDDDSNPLPGVIRIDGSGGPAGADGPPGADGATGATGADGPPGADGADGADGPPVGNYQNYTYDTSTTVSDPGSGKFRLNSASWSLVTTAAVDYLNFQAVDVSTWVLSCDAFGTGSQGIMRFQSLVDASVFWDFVCGPVTDHGGWVEVSLSPATMNFNGTLPTSSGGVLVSYVQGGIGVPAGGTTGQSLTKVSSTDYDTHWSTVTGGSGTTSADTAGWMPLTTTSGGDDVLVFDASHQLIPTFGPF